MASPQSLSVVAWHLLCPLVAGCLLTACSAVGPAYQPPTLAQEAPAAFKEDGPWRTAAPAQVDERTPWWRLFGDAELDGLVAQANLANQTLRQAEAQYRQAQALVQGAAAAYYPTVGASVSDTRGRSRVAGVSTLGDSHAWSLQASWEPDLWGRVRRNVEAASDSAQGSAADLAAARLNVQAAVVNAYVQLRLADAQGALYARTLAGYRKALELTQAQYRAGVALRSDVALAANSLHAAEAQAVDVDLSRRQLEHALAVLLGQAPARFSLPPWPADRAPGLALPVPQPGMPSQLLERRPDIAGAERRMAAANAQIGLAQSAYFPDIVLGAGGGFAGAGLGAWTRAMDAVWSLGLSLTASLLDGGARDARLAQARAAYDGAAAGYRQTVLAAFQEVEDNLAALRQLADEAAAQQGAVAAAETAAQVLLAQYRGGTTNYTAVITAQALALTAQRAALQIRGRQYAASVALVKALGGGWGAQDLPGMARQTRWAPDAAR